uniref:Uncharacterized protein n=1 Tax=Oryctolagus cuniculus TaxID=9986 RepID=A0A5F9DQ67_RABIT
ITTSWRFRRRSTEARRAPRNAFSRAESPYTVASSAPSTDASSTTYTARPSAVSAARSCSARRLLPLQGNPQKTTSGILWISGHVQLPGDNFRVAASRWKTSLPLSLSLSLSLPLHLCSSAFQINK